MTFDLRGNILETSDGGIYKVWNPLNLLGGRKWQSLNGNIRDVELGSVAYDRLNGTVFGGSQDNGSAEQIAPGSYAWRAFGGQDGGFAAVDEVLALNRAVDGQTRR